MTLENMRTVILVAAAVGQTLFVLFYLTLPWWKTFLGRALFFKAVALLLLLNLGGAARIFDLPYEYELFIVLYAMMTLGVWGQLHAFVHQKLESDARAGKLRKHLRLRNYLLSRRKSKGEGTDLIQELDRGSR